MIVAQLSIPAQLSTPESEPGLPCFSQYQENITCGMLGIGSFETIGASEKAGSSEKFEKVGNSSYVGSPPIHIVVFLISSKTCR